jgi:dimethylargininase
MSHMQGIHTFAIAREIPASFADALSSHYGADSSSDGEAFSMQRARQQHASYLSKLRTQLPTLCLSPLESHPDSVFVEDTVVAIGRRALITRPGHPSRRGEVESIKHVLLQLGMDVLDMRDGSEDVICDGGDVMFTGRHIFVGLSDRTNKNGINVLREAFDIEVVTVPPVVQGDQVLHLKSAVTHLDEYTLLAPVGAAGDKVLQAMKAEDRGYKVIRLPDILSCNVVAVNGCILAQDSRCQESRQRLEAATKERNLDLEFIDTSELAKKDAALTCCSVLLSL